MDKKGTLVGLHVRIPDELRRRIKSRAALAGISVQEFVTGLLENEAWPLITIETKEQP